MVSTILPRSEVAGLSAIVAGAGRPVLLLHGVGLRAEAWGAQIEALRGSYQVIAPDMPGHGHSPCPSGPITLAEYAQAFLPILQELAEPALVVGHSMGAMIALELACRAPANVGAVAACNAIFERRPEAAAAVQARAGSLDGTIAPDPGSTLERWFGSAQSDERSACESWLLAANPRGYQLAYTAFAHADGPRRETLQALTCPALFATGALEPNSTPEMSQAMADLAPKGRALIVEGAAHMMPMTHAGALNSALLDFTQEIWP
ncbi:alpha/beta fold hydrolase [Pseudophaeobacter profundi]|jgi:pimeloyl-ACP methyl ester carboxylesterase|uniref:alpha/beta fold hydrolase n=1 Tax=Pseudophaeobacter profundi TaxID=3034152 RepID=UPI00243207AE|nr:alpha/beta hydrolase [Pseudophaeobacter profundi]